VKYCIDSLYKRDSLTLCVVVEVPVECTLSVSWYTRLALQPWHCHAIVSLWSYCPSVREWCTPRYSRCPTYLWRTIIHSTW